MSLYWILTLVPVFIIHLLLGVGIMSLFVVTFVGKIPFVKQYKLPLQIVALILAVTGVYLEGALGYKESVAKEVAELKLKLVQAEAKSAKTNTEIVEKIVKDTEVIRLKGKTITQYVDREIVKHDNKCELPVEVIRAHNAAATMDTSKLDGEQK